MSVDTSENEDVQPPTDRTREIRDHATFEIVVEEGGAIDLIGRWKEIEIELIAEIARVDEGTIRLDGVHFTKNSGPRLTHGLLVGFAQAFLLWRNAKKLVVQGARRTTGTKPGRIPSPLYFSVD